MAICFGLLLSGCAPSTIGTSPAYPSPWHGSGQGGLATQNETLDLENADRIRRFARLSRMAGVLPPTIESDTAPAGTAPGLNRPVPVVRVTFPEGVLFDTDKDEPRPEAEPILRLIAENMRRDVPDAAVTILGHTDSTGSEAHNDDLSRRRALHVMQRLASDGVDPYQMTTVAIGFHQPIASNATPEGRAQNRRVEFLISANVEANLAVVQRRSLPSVNVAPHPTTPLPSERPEAPTSVQVFQAAPVRKKNEVALSSVGPLELQPINASTLAEVHSLPLAPPPLVNPRPLTPVAPASLTDQKIS
jgi:outer membrane protein OmpA-like peptidoglycan-associated protein